MLLAFEVFLKWSCVELQPESNKSEILEKALDLLNKLLSLGYQVRVLPQVHKLLGLR